MPLTDKQRQTIVKRNEVMDWDSVSWLESGVKGPKGGIDCGQILAGVYINADFLSLTRLRSRSITVSR